MIIILVLAEESRSTLRWIASSCEGKPPTDTSVCSSVRPHHKSGSVLGDFAGTQEAVCNLTAPGKNQDYNAHTRSFQADSQCVVSHSRLELAALATAFSGGTCRRPPRQAVFDCDESYSARLTRHTREPLYRLSPRLRRCRRRQYRSL